MSIYISGMEMPKEGTVIAIYKLKGQFYASMHGTELCPLIPVLDHGRLIDEKDIVPKDGYIIADGMACIPVKDIVNAPTIIPADPEDKEGER